MFGAVSQDFGASTVKQNKKIRICFKTYLNVAPSSETEMLHGQTKACSKSA